MSQGNRRATMDQEEENTLESDEQKKVQSMRAFVESKDPSAKVLDDVMIRRFLRARDLDIKKGSTLLLNNLSWRRSFVPKGFISPSQIVEQLSDEKVYLQGHDKQGRPLVVIFGAKHKPRSGEAVEDLKRLVAYCLDKICASIPSPLEKFVVIIDLEGWRYVNCDIRGYIAALSILQEYYPERLGKLYLIHVSYLFMAAYKIVYPFIDEKTRQKIQFIENQTLKSSLLLDLDESMIPDVYGGKLPLVPIDKV